MDRSARTHSETRLSGKNAALKGKGAAGNDKPQRAVRSER
jgi:hypothetical protein